MAASRDEFVGSISRRLSREEPMPRVPSETAAVAVILAGSAEGRKVLLMRRPEREDDPWSGQVALPGGRVQTGDGSFEQTAIRETREEVGIDLRDSMFLGYLGRFRARTRGIWVVPSIFVSDDVLSVNAGPEVASYRWIPLHQVIDRTNRSTYRLQRGGGRRSPAFVIGDYVVWGLTERILSALTGHTGA